VAESDTLLAEERFAQAAEDLQQASSVAADALGAERPRVLGLRSRRAAILVIGGDFRRALPEFDALADAYARTAGPTSRDALDCLRQAAHCRAQLGQTTMALRQFQQVLTHVRAESAMPPPPRWTCAATSGRCWLPRAGSPRRSPNWTSCTRTSAWSTARTTRRPGRWPACWRACGWRRAMRADGGVRDDV